MSILDRVELNPRVCNGKPVIKGTRIPVTAILDQCMRLEVAEALRGEGYDVLRASDVGKARADDSESLRSAGSEASKMDIYHKRLREAAA